MDISKALKKSKKLRQKALNNVFSRKQNKLTHSNSHGSERNESERNTYKLLIGRNVKKKKLKKEDWISRRAVTFP